MAGTAGHGRRAVNPVVKPASTVLDAIRRHALTRGRHVAIDAGECVISYRELLEMIDAVADELRARRCKRLALLADNGPAWAIIDLAALAADVICVPLPLFFSAAQIAHALESAAIDTLIADPRLVLASSLSACDVGVIDALPPEVGVLRAYEFPPYATTALPAATCKITYTSGTTGEPKGVCLAAAQQERVAEALWQASAAGPDSRHLSVLPLSTLLENIGGLYAPLLAGATTCLRPLSEVGLSGASQLDVRRLLEAIRAAEATTVILVPQMLQALVEAIEAGAPRPLSLRFAAVGGASVSPRLLQRAHTLGLPVFEGYGLSECASVVAVNRVDARRSGTVGQPLPQLRITLADDGEIFVAGNGFLGYVGEAARDPATPVGTGDIGHVDDDGFLHITGRKKNIFVTAFGRNVAPEWVERELCLQPAIAQAAVFGEAAPYNIAVIVARTRDVVAIDAAIDRVNRDLPDYARVRRWIAADAPFTTTNDQATANGRLRRIRIQVAYAAVIQSLYQADACVENFHEETQA